jgi:hypothetical protein
LRVERRSSGIIPVVVSGWKACKEYFPVISGKIGD